MKKLRFKELIILSLIEKSARRINLDADTTVITSKDNDTGKSCLIKSIYHALGCDIVQFHPTWRNINPITLLKFIKDGAEYSIFRYEKLVILFNQNLEIIEKFTSIGNELSAFYEDFFSFNIKLIHSSSKEMKVPFPSHYFLPFYIDQDSSWKKSWNSFDKLNAFTKWKLDLIEYHTGIKPNEYYNLKSKKAQKIQERKEQIDEYNTINRVYLKKLNKENGIAKLNINIREFKEQIDELIENLNRIKNKENSYKEKILELKSQIRLIDKQILLAEKTGNNLNKDLEYAEKLDEEIECPLCGTIHKNNFSQRYAIAQDENRCYELILSLKQDKGRIESKIQKLRETIEDTSEDKYVIEDILTYKKGEVKFRDYIDNIGEKKLIQNIKLELNDINKVIEKYNEQVKNIEKDMRKYTDKERKEEIEKYYIELMTDYLYKLNVNMLEQEDYKSISCTIKENGSDLPRALLAYYYSILHVMKKYSSTYDCPIVIDSPLQDEQSEENTKRILEFIRDNRPENTQLILSCMQIDSMKYNDKIKELNLNGVKYDKVNLIELKNKYQLLDKEKYQSIFEEFKETIEKGLEFRE
ncbi:hypothetical protein DIC82_05630 [Clostridium beijerinckii]|nr:hypothetical protein DIC82_05630 [Clostridium beijerinckii]